MRIYLSLLFILIASVVFGQKFTTEQSSVSFYSHAAVEDISAKNTATTSIFNSATGEIVFSIPVTDFVFEKSLMQEHFNEKYLETETYPKSTFKGKIIGFNESATGEQQVKAQGKLTLHGVTKDIEVSGTAVMKSTKLVLKSKFIIVLEDYNVKRPKFAWQNIAEQVEVTVEFTYKPL
ncbi:MAG: YceI family protein [Azospira oryzae]|jgi:polyisoprenoid-binding protein YceI|nr:MAG: YceI family protein [Azospira oryzae]